MASQGYSAGLQVHRYALLVIEVISELEVTLRQLLF